MLRLASELWFLKSLRLTASAFSLSPFRNFEVILLTRCQFTSLVMNFSRSSVFTEVWIVVPAFLSCSLLFGVRSYASLEIKQYLVAWSLPWWDCRKILLLLSCDSSIHLFAFLIGGLLLEKSSCRWLRLILLFGCLWTISAMLSKKIIHDFKAKPIDRWSI